MILRRTLKTLLGAPVVLLLLLLAPATHVAHGQASDEIEALDRKIGEMLAGNQVEQAVELLERALKLTEARYGPNHVNTGLKLRNLSILTAQLSRLPDAVAAATRAVAILEQAGVDHQNLLAHALRHLA